MSPHRANEPELDAQPRVIYLFSGPAGMPTGFDHYCGQLHGVRVIVADERVDAVNFDLAEDAAWGRIVQDIKKGIYRGGLLSPPCSTFVPARSNHNASEREPGMLRGSGVPDIYGLPGFPGEDKERVLLGTLLAKRAAQAAAALHERGCPWIFETPARWPEQPSMFELPEAKSLDELAGVQTRKFVQ